MRRRNGIIFVVSLLVFAVLLTGVYALLAGTLNITGTTRGTGDFKIEFNSYSVSNENKATVTLDDTRTSMTISADLSFPGDTVTIDFVIKNVGSLAASVQNIAVNENSTDDFDIKVNGVTNIVGTNLGVGETTNGSVVITWNASGTNPEPESVSFDVTLAYIQAT